MEFDMNKSSAFLSIIIISAICFSGILHAADQKHLDEAAHNSHPYSLEAEPESGRLTDWWAVIWGRPAVDSLHLGMWSLHLDGSGDIFGSGSNNEHNYLLGFQLKGYNFCTFINSHDDRTYSLGLSREVYSKQLSPDLRFDAGYRLGFLYGYKDNLPSIGGVSGYAMPVFGLSWKRLGVDLGVVPVGVLTLSFRIDIDRRQ